MAVGSVFRRSGGWCYRVDIGPDPDTGKRRQRSRQGFRTRRDAESALRAVLVDTAADRPVAGMTVGEFLTEWVDRQSKLVRESTAHAYRLAVRRIGAGLGSVSLAELSAADVARFEADLVTCGSADGGPLSRRTVANTHSVFFQAMEIAVRDGHCASNPVAQVQPPKPVERDVTVWTLEELRGFLDVAVTHRLGAAFMVLATTGMRRGEVLGLRWRDVDLDEGWLSVTQTLTEVAGTPIVTVPKTAAARRRIDLDRRTLAALRTHREDADPDAVFVFQAVGGGPVNPRSFSHTFDRLVDRAGVRRIRLHDVRHTYASLALRNGMYPVELSERLGHTSVSMTMNVYAHLIPTSDRRRHPRPHLQPRPNQRPVTSAMWRSPDIAGTAGTTAGTVSPRVGAGYQGDG